MRSARAASGTRGGSAWSEAPGLPPFHEVAAEGPQPLSERRVVTPASDREPLDDEAPEQSAVLPLALALGH